MASSKPCKRETGARLPACRRCVVLPVRRARSLSLRRCIGGRRGAGRTWRATGLAADTSAWSAQDTEAYCAGATGNGTEQSGLHGREGESRRRVKRMGRPTDRPISPSLCDLRDKEGTKRNRDLRGRQRPDHAEEESRWTREQSQMSGGFYQDSGLHVRR